MMNLKDLKSTAQDLRDLDKDDLLELLGLETRRTTSDALLPVLGAFSVGLLLGAGVGLLLAPKPGAELRGDLRGRIKDGQDAVAKAADQARAEISNRTS
ncbi:YtxH domain-containing protein [[Archangium] primigenium]|uniref:YtxH domain-containing protein n=1 Tax=Melittangium TaxID=44 RepID=UPI00195DC7D6|nr:YtxH domain-containing protein [Archangium primigenium]MBM7115134.1 YtxH domain-containing protein [Archangium primigenium]